MPKFVVRCVRHLSTPNSEDRRVQYRTIEFGRKPTRKDFPAIESALELQFLKDARAERNIKNVLSVSYKIKKVLGPLHDWKVVAMADHIGGSNLYKCSKCEKQELVPREPGKEG